MSWNPEQYLKFLQPRLRPALDLLAAVPDLPVHRAVDLGCGTGHITRSLARRWPHAEVTGVDDSSTMLATATAEPSSIHWQQQGLADWRAAQPVDLIYSNAALHWLPDHTQLMPALLAQLAPGGVLAVQMPRNFSAPSHALIADTVHSGPWRLQLEHLLQPPPVSAPDVYYGVLAPLSCRLDIWETEYMQVLTGADPVKEWTKGTWLMQFLNALDVADRRAFEDDYAARLRTAYPVRADGSTLFPFKRLFIVATAR